jgi:tRNA threonylcarbamoyladenosine biosynthesis protein TsaE
VSLLSTAVRVTTHSPDETKRAAAALAPLLREGDVLLLSSDLGGGKTVFVQGLAEALGVYDVVSSPTFVLAQSYRGRDLRLHHLDVYRLNQAREVLDLGLDELLDDRAVTAIEWGERVIDYIGPSYLAVRVFIGSPEEPEQDRVIEFEAVGPAWADRAESLRSALTLATERAQ